MRSLAYVLMARMLLVRMGPLCDAAAATPAAMDMAMVMVLGDCREAPTSPKHPAASSCATGCMTLPAKVVETGPGEPRDPIGLTGTSTRSLAGLSGGPAPPPPRS